MNIKVKSFFVILLTITLFLIMKGITAYAYIGSTFNYTNEGQTITYTVLSEPTETENGTAKVIYSAEINKNLVGKVSIPATVTNQKMTYNVIGIGNFSLHEAKDITSITLPDTITFIEEDAFYGCSGLKDINIPHGVTRIEKGTFNGCSSLNSMNLPEGLTYVGSYAFNKCSSLSSINIPDQLTYIGSNAFYHCSKLYAMKLPKGINYLGAGAFEGCSNLTSITIPEGITSIDNNLFKDCISLASVSMPEGLMKIGKNAFYNCSSLTIINLPYTVTSIGEYAFYLCTSLTNIKIPYAITKIENNTFSGCSSLTEIRIQDKLTSIGDFAFLNCRSLLSIKLPEGLVSIGNYAFYRCDNLRPITIPSSVTKIGNGDFPYSGVFVYHNSYAEEFFKKNQPEYYQIIKLPLEEMSFAESIKNIRVDETVILKPIFYPVFSSDITNTIHWTSSNPSIISVDANGAVKGLQAGEADITAIMGNYSATCHIIAGGITTNPTSIEFTNNNIAMNKGETVKLQLNFLPENATNRSITWTSSDNTVVTVENGRIYAKNPGTAIVTAISAGTSKECKVTVLNPLKEINSDYNNITLNKGETKKVVISYDPFDTSDDKTIIWRSEDETVATVKNGIITAMKPGTTTIIATVGALTKRISVSVIIPIKSLSMSQMEIALKVGQTQVLPLVILPYDTTDKVIITSSDKSVATYSAGTITALKRGQTTITAVSGSFTTSCLVTVGTDIDNITLNKKSLNLYLGRSETLIGTFQQANIMDDKTITWKSSDKSVATVDAKGKITTVGTGTATITATAGGSITDTCLVVVKLSVPTTLKTVSGGYDNIKISWGVVSGASGYRIYRADSLTGSFIRIKDTTSRSYTDTGLTTGKTYYYKVRGYRYQGTKKVYSSYTKIVNTVPVPSTPDNVKLVKLSSGRINFTWNEVRGATGYEIYRTSSTNEPFKLTKTTTSLHFMNYGLTKGRTYYYKVRAYKMVGKLRVYSKFSAVFSIKI